MPRLLPLRRPRHLAHTLRRLAAGLLAVAALLLALRPPGPATAVEPPPGEPVVVAAADLPAGTRLAAGDLTTTELPSAAVPGGAGAEPAGLVGAVLASPLRAGEAVTDARLVGPGLWSQVGAGQVAAPVRLADLAVAGLLRAGDRVDVLATRSGSGDDGARTDVVAQGALVLAVPAAGADDGLLVLAVATDTAGLLATAATEATLTVTLGAP